MWTLSGEVVLAVFNESPHHGVSQSGQNLGNQWGIVGQRTKVAGSNCRGVVELALLCP